MCAAGPVVRETAWFDVQRRSWAPAATAAPSVTLLPQWQGASTHDPMRASVPLFAHQSTSPLSGPLATRALHPQLRAHVGRFLPVIHLRSYCCRPLPLQRVLFIHAREPMWVPEVRWSASLADLELVVARGARLRYVSLYCRIAPSDACWVGRWCVRTQPDLEARWGTSTLRVWPLECVRPSTPLLAICPLLQPAGAAAAAAAHSAQRGHAAPLAGRRAAHAAPQLLLDLRGM